MKIDYEVKELTKEDLDKDLNGFLESLKNLSETGKISLEDAKNILDKMNSQNAHIFVAVTEDGQIIGATTLFVEQKFIHKGGKAGHIEDVVTKKGYEGMGVGSATMKKALEFGKNAGCYKIILDCADSLIPFYEKFGFKLFEKCMRLKP